MMRPFVSLQVIAALVLVGLAGCGSRGRPADASVARSTVQRALEAWQQGTSLADFQKSSPQVTVVEPLWKKGARLVKFDIDGEGVPTGFDLRVVVKLSLQDSGGQKFQQVAIYHVSTAPSLVVVRAEE
jgi:hypothetical protein